MRVKGSDAQRKANVLARAQAMAALDTEALHGTGPDTWSARMPAYTYTELCPDPALREAPKGVKGNEQSREAASGTPKDEAADLQRQ